MHANTPDAVSPADAAWPTIAPVDYWEQRYATRDQVWSGAANRVLSSIASDLAPGTALDLGCGEGADVLWLAQHGWTATGIDISPTAIRRAVEAARTAGIEVEDGPSDRPGAHGGGATTGRTQFLVGDLSDLPDRDFDLVTSSFLHSPVALAREDILRRASRHVAPGGHLLVTSHTAVPDWSTMDADHRPVFATPSEQVTQLALEDGMWDVVVAETRPRTVTLPDGETRTLEDAVVFARRRAHGEGSAPAAHDAR